MDYNSMYPLSEPQPEPEPEICYTKVDPFTYLMMTFGAGVGYFMMGSFLSFLCCEKHQRDRPIILANAIPI